MADYVQVSGNHAATTASYTAKQKNTGTGSGFDDVLKAQEDKSAQTQTEDTKSESAQDANYRQQLQEHMEEMIDKIKHGTIQPKIKIGAQEYTQEEWKKLLEKFDEAEEELIEQVEAEIAMRMENAEKEKAEMEEAAKAEMTSEKENAVDSPS